MHDKQSIHFISNLTDTHQLGHTNKSHAIPNNSSSYSTVLPLCQCNPVQPKPGQQLLHCRQQHAPRQRRGGMPSRGRIAVRPGAPTWRPPKGLSLLLTVCGGTEMRVKGYVRRGQGPGGSAQPMCHARRCDNLLEFEQAVL